MIPDSLKERAAKLLQPYLSDKISVWNGVAIRDEFLLSQKDHYPHHKERLTAAALAHSARGDRVVFVGGGPGVVPVRAAREGRHVLVHEAAAEYVTQLRETAALNEVVMNVEHSLVESGRDVYGTTDGARRVNSDSLAGDVLVLDCEGAERDIVPTPQFDTVIIETHPQHGAPTDMVREQLAGDVAHWRETKHDGDILIRK